MGALRVGTVRSMKDRALDEAVAVEVAGFRWVEWDHTALRGSPLDQPGCFLARADDPLAHLHVAATGPRGAAPDALAHVPHYSLLVDDAIRAADSVGLFSRGEASVGRTPDGRWRVLVPAAAAEILDGELAVALCQAALRWVRTERSR